MRGQRKEGANIDLGLAVSALSLRPGETRSLGDLAAFCGCSRGNMWHLEQQALHKIKRAIFMRKDPVMCELVEAIRK